MLQWLKERLSSAPVHGNEEVITDPGRIHGLLAACINRGQVFSVRILNNRGVYESRILENGEQLLLEELSPIDGHIKVAPGCTLCLEAETEDEWIRFETRIDGIQDHGNVQAYGARTPDALHWDKRRDSPRLPVNETEGMSVELTDSRSMDAGLHDLSLSGIGLRVDSDTPLQEGDVLEGVAINLPDGRRIEGNVEVRHSMADDDEKQRIGGRFIASDDQALHNVLNWLADTDGTLEQRRSEPRLHLGSGDAIAISLTAGDSPIEATLDNISSNGLGLSFSDDHYADVAVGDRLDAVEIQSPDGREIHGHLNVRYVESEQGRTRIGGEFTVTTETVADLSELVAWLADASS